MTTTSKYNLSSIMSKAWSIHRSKWQYASSFSMCLKRAWEIAKEEIAQREEEASLNAWINRPRVKAELSTESKANCYQAMVSSMASLYANGVYSGD